MCRRSRCGRVNGYKLVDSVQLCDGLLISGERACFVGADHRHGAKSFDRMKLLNDRLALGHAQHAKSKRDSCHDWQALWDGSDDTDNSK